MKVEPALVAVVDVMMLYFPGFFAVENFVKTLVENVADFEIQVLANGHVAIGKNDKAVEDAVTAHFHIVPAPLIIQNEEIIIFTEFFNDLRYAVNEITGCPFRIMLGDRNIACPLFAFHLLLFFESI